MMISKAYMTSIYTLSLILFFNYTSPFIFWVLTELNLLFFIMMIYLFKNVSLKQEMFDLTLFYFLIQSMASILLLSDFFFSSDFFIFNSDYMFLLAISIKLGIFPFFYWVFKICEFLNYFSMGLLLTFQKIPFYLIMFNSLSSLVFFFLLSSFITGAILVVFSKNLIQLLVASSISSSFWLIYLFGFSSSFFLFFFLLYSFFLFYLINLYTGTNDAISSKFWISLIFFSFLMGLSPFSLFFFKFYIVSFLMDNFGMTELIFFWIFSFLSLFGYLSFSLKSFFSSSCLYSDFNKFGSELFFFFLSSISFFFFVL